MQTPILPVVKAEYLCAGMGQVRGWLRPSTAVYLSSLEVLQQRAGTGGDVCEIGVHHGKSFLTLALGLAAGETAVAIDVFGDQAANLDGSGKGDQQVFEAHLDRFGIRDAVEVICGSSLALEEQGFLGRGRRFRLFSVDGGHTADITRNDLDVAQRTIVDDGIVILDDILNPHWTGVVSGLFDYWAKGGTLVPAVMLPGKLALTATQEKAEEHRALMREQFARGCEKAAVPFGPGHVDVYGEASWAVRDVDGGERLLPGPGNRLPNEEKILPVPESYLRGLESRADRLQAALDAPVTRELARRYPRLAGVTRPARSTARRAARKLRR